MCTIVKFKTLIGLAKVDGEFDSSEKSFIKTVAERQGFTMQSLKTHLQTEEKIGPMIQRLSFEDRIDILTHLVKMMKVDGKVLLSEIKYCERVAKSFGFAENSIEFLKGLLDDDPSATPNFGRIKHGMKSYMQKAA